MEWSGTLVGVTRTALADHIYEQLLHHLMDGQLWPGDRVGIDSTARAMDVSPTPVREALARLESTGLVVREAMRGYRVPPLLSEDLIRDLMDVRILIEARTAELACAAADAKFFEALEATMTDLRAAPHGSRFDDYRQYWQADERFHRLIAEQTGNDYIVRAYDSLGGHMQRFRLFSGRGVSDPECAATEHQRVLSALKSGDCLRAAEMMRTHIEAVRDRAINERQDLAVGLAAADPA